MTAQSIRQLPPGLYPEMSGGDRYSLSILRRDGSAATVTVDDLRAEEIHHAGVGPELVLVWSRGAMPEATLSLGVFGDLAPEEYVALRRAVWRLVFDRTDRLDVAKLLEEIRDRLAEDEDEDDDDEEAA